MSPYRRGPIPPRPNLDRVTFRMRRMLLLLGALSFATALSAAGAALLFGCAALFGESDPATVATQQSDIAAYAAAQIQCVDLAANRAQADQCRDDVKAKWCGPGGALRDAGACAYDAEAPAPTSPATLLDDAAPPPDAPMATDDSGRGRVVFVDGGGAG